MAASPVLELGLDFPLPADVRVGAGTALFVCGWCFCADSDVRSLALLVDGHQQPVMDHGMPRRDVLDSFAVPRSYRSGFWGLARLEPNGGGEREIGLRATLDDGTELASDLAGVPVAPPLAEPLSIPECAPGSGPFVAICMAAYDPPDDLFRQQLESIRAQTYPNWVCAVSDDCSSPARLAALEQALEGDARFALSRSPRRLGFYLNFERALGLAPEAAEYVAMADQDDRWHPDKLESLVGAIGDAELIYSDARVIAPDGEVLSDTYWSLRRNNHSDISSLLVANAITGAASLCRREVLSRALPFPPRQFAHFHDHWLGLTALALGEIRFVDRPLYDYVQHGDAVLGHAAANRMPTLRQRLGGLRRGLRERVRLWRLTYFVDGCRLVQFATVLRMRCGEQMSAPKRRAIDRFIRADRSPVAIAALALRAARELVGKKPETLGAELGLMFAFLWRNLVAISVRGRESPRRRLQLDALPPTTLLQDPGRTSPDEPSIRTVAEKIAPLELAPRDDAPRRINLLIPTIDLDHFFGGYIAKLNLARRLAERGERVRVVTVDPVPPLPSSWRRTLESYSGLAGVFDRVEVVFARESQGIEVSRSDAFIASTWWTAHIAHRAVRSLGGERFLYLIQEYEPFTFPMGTYAALAAESYRFPHQALFSSELLRGYFREHRLGIYAGEHGDDLSASFENAITAFEPPRAADLAAKRTRTLLFYARPEAHASRNMFELGALAVARAVEDGAFHGWELHGIGTIESRRRLGLGGDAVIELLPRKAQEDYANLLRDHDVGLALMYTPHPSLVPIEMAAAGMRTVTNSFENKTPEAMAAISPNLIAVEPSLDALVAGLRRAAAEVGDFDARARGSEVNWSRDWDRSFDDELMARVQSMLGS